MRIKVKNILLVLCLLSIILFSGCVGEIVITEDRVWTTEEEESMLIQVESMNFSEILGYDNINLTEISLPFTYYSSNYTHIFPHPPLSNSDWNSYFISSSKSKKIPWNHSKSTTGMDITCEYFAEIEKQEKIPSFPMIYKYSFKLDSDNVTYIINKSIVPGVGNSFSNGFSIIQTYNYKLVSVIGAITINYEQILFVDLEGTLVFGYFDFGRSMT